MLFVEKNINFNKNETKSNTFTEANNRELRLKLWWVRARERKISAFFVTFILSEEIFSAFAFYLNA